MLRNHVLPAFLIGWNTFGFRFFFGLLLPLLMVICHFNRQPFFLSFCITIEPKQLESNIFIIFKSSKKLKTRLNLFRCQVSPFAVWMVKYSSQYKGDEMLINGEMFLVEHEEDSKAQLFRLCTKYFVLQVTCFWFS